MTLHNITGWRDQGKVTMNIAMSKFYLRMGRTVVFVTNDQRRTVAMLSSHFPKALFELVDTWGVKIHERY